MSALPIDTMRFTRVSSFPNPPGAGRQDMAASQNARPSKRQP